MLQVIDAEGPEERAELLEWLRSRHLPKRLAGSPAAMVTVFRPTPLPLDRMSYVKQVEGVDTRLTLLWFLEADPRDRWEASFGGLGDAVAEGGLGRLELLAPFVPTVPGTDRYVDGSAGGPGGPLEGRAARGAGTPRGGKAEPPRPGRRAGREGSVGGACGVVVQALERGPEPYLRP